MASCRFTLNSQTYTALDTPVGSLTAFSGNGPHRNNPRSANVADNGPIPPGMYHIVDRGSGGLVGAITSWALGRDEWFALYRDEERIDDQTFVEGVRRGNFRLHPLGPRGISTGCIVLQYAAEFSRLRKYLVSQPKEYVEGTGYRTYGTVSVGEIVDMLDGRFRGGRDRPRSRSV
jgi:hypothetical protein